MPRRRTVACTIFVYAAGLSIVHAQEPGLGWLNFNIGGGLSVPVNPTATYAGVFASGTAGAGVNFDKHNSVEGDFLWLGFPLNYPPAHQRFRPDVRVDQFALTAQYRFRIDDIGESPIGFYVLAGGGWYHRLTTIEGHLTIPPQIACQPIYNWWGLACTPNGLVAGVSGESRGSNAGGINGGLGFTVRFPHSGWKVFAESRYHYVWSTFVRTTFIPITFGLRYN
jgi:hypothetical protein